MITQTAIVARDPELSQLDAFLAQALSGECSICFVSGEAGTGKTALITEFARRAQDRDPDLVVALGDCNARTGVGDPYLPFREVLNLLTGDVEGSLAQDRITPENADRLREFRTTSIDALSESGPDLARIFLPRRALPDPRLAERGRRLSALWFADVVGYSRLSSRDEPAALRLAALLQEVAHEQVERSGGRLVKFMGDAVLAEFASADAAVRTASGLVREFAERADAEGQPAALRVGVHLGDVARAPDGDLYGNGVNVAARIQGEAEPGQVLVTEDVGRQLAQRPEFRFTSLGERDLKGMPAPVAVFAAEVEGGEESPPEGDRSDTSADLDQSHIFEQYTNVLRSFSAHRPLVLILDDLQWADAASIDLLFHLSRRLGSSRVLLLGTYRPNDVSMGREGDRHPLDPVLNELKRYHGDIWVDLSAAQENRGRELVDALVDAEPNRLGPAFRADLLRHTDGHPLFTLELLRHMRESGHLVRDEDGVWLLPGSDLVWDELPPRVEGVIGERVDRLDEELRDTLDVASVEGQRFTAEVIARVREADGRGIVRCLSGDLEKQHRLVEAEGRQSLGSQRLSIYRFRHHLFQRYLYSALDGIERSLLHEDVGTVLEGLYGDEPDVVAVDLARHFQEAGDVTKAVRYLLRAGERARSAYANAEAVRHFRHALELIEAEVTDTFDPAERSATIMRLREDLGETLALIGRHEDARSSYRDALDLAPKGEPLAHARLQRKAGKTWEAHGQLDEALDLFAAAEAALGSEPAGEDPDWWREWLQIQLDRVMALYFGGRVQALMELIEKTEPVIQQHGTPRQRAALLQAGIMVDLRRESYRLTDESLAKAAAYLAAAEEVDTSHQYHLARFQYGFSLLWYGDLDGAEPHLRTALEFTERTGNLRYQTLALTYLAFVHRLRGEVEATRECAGHALERATAGNMDPYVAAAKCNLSWVALREADHDTAKDLASAALETWERSPIAMPLKPYALLPIMAIHIQADRLDSAIESARKVFEAGQQPPPPELDAALRQAIEQWDADQPARAAEGLHHALELARRANYV